MNNEELKQEIELLKTRNKRVEADKAWETSYTRKIFVAIVTYIFMVIFMYSIEVEDVFINALVPTFGYLLSTLSLSFVKKYWIDSKTL